MVYAVLFMSLPLWTAQIVSFQNHRCQRDLLIVPADFNVHLVLGNASAHKTSAVQRLGVQGIPDSFRTSYRPAHPPLIW